MGAFVPFFKKNKPTAKRLDVAPSKKEIKHDISAMDRDLDLDDQLKDLTARLNLSESSLSAAPISSASASAPPPKAGTPSVGEMGSVNNALDNYKTPTFSAKISPNAKGLNVTSGDAKPDEEAEPITPAAVLGSPSRLNMSALRVDVAKISSDIQSGEELYRRALQRVEGLMGQVEKAEIDFSVLNRLEPENRRLKVRLRSIQGEFEDKKNKVSILEADLDDHKERLNEKTSQYENARARLTTTTKSLREYERVLKATKSEAERVSIALDRNKTALDVEGRENKVLREKISDLSTELEARQTEYLDASKAAESLRNDCEDFRDQAETLRAEAQDLRVTLNTAKRQNNAMKGEMLSLHEDIKTFKAEYEFNVLHREDQLTELETEVSTLRKAIDKKDSIALTQSSELSKLRKMRIEQDIERDRLESSLQTIKRDMTETASLDKKRSLGEITQLKSNIQALQTEIHRRDEISEHSAKDADRLRTQLSELTQEKEQLKTELDIQTQKFEQAADIGPVATLEAKVEQLSEQLRLKDEIVKDAAQDIQQLRQHNEEQKAQQKKLEDQIQDQRFQLEAARKEILTSKQNEASLDQRYKDVAAALSVNTARQRNTASAQSPDITDDFNDVSDDDVAKRVLDYKLGLRKDII